MNSRYMTLASKLLSERFPVVQGFTMERTTCILEAGFNERLLLSLTTGADRVGATLVYRDSRGGEKSCCCQELDMQDHPQVRALAGVLWIADKAGITERFLELQDEAAEGGAQ